MTSRGAGGQREHSSDPMPTQWISVFFHFPSHKCPEFANLSQHANRSFIAARLQHHRHHERVRRRSRRWGRSLTKIDICKVFAISRRTCGQPKQGEFWEASHPKTLASAAMRGDRRTNNL